VKRFFWMVRIVAAGVFFIAMFAPVFDSPGTLFAQEPSAARAFNLVPLAGSDELDKAISDPRIGVLEKRLAIQRLAQLAGELKGPRAKDVAPSRLFNPLLGVLTPQDSVRDHYILREEACTALAAFSTLEGSEQLVGPLGKRLQDSGEREEVRMSAARSLAKFRNNASAAASQLVAALNQEIERGPKADNINLATGIVVALGHLGDKQSFVPLMRVVQSNFPNTTKRRAQASLEAIRWK
jgi:HEAT repeat protein